MAPSECLFCRIVAGDIPADTVFDDEHVVAFTDVAPQAPIHVLVVPRAHVSDLLELACDRVLAGAYLAGVRATAVHLGLTDFRTVFNTGEGAGQSVFHVHAHLLAGRPMNWPPG